MVHPLSLPSLPHSVPPGQVLEANRGLQAGLADTIEDIQQRLLASYLRMRGRSGEL